MEENAVITAPESAAPKRPTSEDTVRLDALLAPEGMASPPVLTPPVILSSAILPQIETPFSETTSPEEPVPDDNHVEAVRPDGKRIILRRRRSRRPKARPEVCPNCLRPSDADHNFCPNCGQEHGHPSISLFEVFRDVWDEFARIDSRLLKTLLPLLFRPGVLTREYMAGRRARYIAPFKMYLVVTFFFFTILSWKTQDRISREIGHSQASLAKSMAQDSQKLQKVADRLASSSPGSASRRPKATHQWHDKGVNIQIDDLDAAFTKLPKTAEEYRSAQEALPPGRRDSQPIQLVKFFLIRYQSGDPGSLVSGVFDAASKMMFFLLPIHALLLQLLYLRQRRLYVEHFVYSLHVHTVFFLYLTFIIVLPFPFAKQALAVVFPVYSVLALHKFYRQGIFKTLFKFGFLVSSYSFVLVIAMITTLLLSMAAQSGFLAAQRSML